MLFAREISLENETEMSCRFNIIMFLKALKEAAKSEGLHEPFKAI